MSIPERVAFKKRDGGQRVVFLEQAGGLEGRED